MNEIEDDGNAFEDALVYGMIEECEELIFQVQKFYSNMFANYVENTFKIIRESHSEGVTIKKRGYFGEFSRNAKQSAIDKEYLLSAVERMKSNGSKDFDWAVSELSDRMQEIRLFIGK